ncbi:MAG: hypothetical protein Q8N15_00775 [Bacillota bacterium]|nr:hypothetical protein [Bacillota bacterium]
MPYLIGGIVLSVLIAIYVLSYKLNEKTKAPEGCAFPEGFDGCGGCKSAACASRVPGKPEEPRA